jgi:hypothetical protein
MNAMCPNSKIVILISIIVIGIVVGYFYIFYTDQINALKQALYVCESTRRVDNHSGSEHSQSNYSESEDRQSDQPNIIIAPQPIAPIPRINPLREFDYRALNDKLTPPLRRDDWTIPVIPLPTRGFPTAYKKMGTLIQKDGADDHQQKFLILMGRQKYQGSNYYDYFVTENKQDSYIKFPVHDLHKELFNGDEITIRELGKVYIVHVDKELGYEYLPYAF